MNQPILQDSITLERTIFTNLSTIGEIHVDGEFFCYSLELSCRKGNPNGKLAIPSGKYEITLADKPISPLELKVGYPLPLLNNVPGRDGIRIHVANWPHELEGCIAPGFRKDIDAIYDSAKALEKLIAEIKIRLARGKLFIGVVGGRSA